MFNLIISLLAIGIGGVVIYATQSSSAFDAKKSIALANNIYRAYDSVEASYKASAKKFNNTNNPNMCVATTATQAAVRNLALTTNPNPTVCRLKGELPDGAVAIGSGYSINYTYAAGQANIVIAAPDETDCPRLDRQVLNRLEKIINPATQRNAAGTVTRTGKAVASVNATQCRITIKLDYSPSDPG